MKSKPSWLRRLRTGFRWWCRRNRQAHQRAQPACCNAPAKVRTKR
ncbi:hypothetical protein [Niveibacterium terrae]